MDYVQLFKSADLVFPESLVPIYTVAGEIDYFIKANNNQDDNDFVWSFCAGDGDREIYLEYDSLTQMAQTLIEEHKIRNTNRYPDTEGHYIDANALSKIQAKLNPNKHNPKQTFDKSPTGIKNVYEIEDLHSVWG